MSTILKVKKRGQLESLVLFIYILPFLFAFCFELVKLPSFIRYFIDVAWVLLLFVMLVRTKLIQTITLKKLLIWVGCFFVYCTILYMYRYQSIFYYLWGFRNNFRFYIFFFGCILFLKKKEVEDYMSILDIVFYINSIVIMIQYFLGGFRRDSLGGVFGTQQGCNGYLNIFLIIVLTKSILFYLHKRESVHQCMFKIVLITMSAAFAELKFFFMEFAVIIILAALVTKLTRRKIFIMLISGLGIYFGIELLLIVFPEFEEIMSVQGLFESAMSDQGYTSAGDMNRLTALSMSEEMFLKTTEDKLFGLGLGNCDYSDNYSFLTSPFFVENKLLHYTWLSVAFIFLETGYVGLCFFFGFYIILFWEIDKQEKREKQGESSVVYCHIAKVLAIMCILIAIYNSTLRTEAAYMLYFVMAIPFLCDARKFNYTNFKRYEKYME